MFPAERGDGYFQGTKRTWAKAIKKALLPGVTPHTLRHTIGSTAISTGEAVALTGAILGHANPRSTAIYAHVQNDSSKRAANRVTKKIAAVLAGKSAPLAKQQKTSAARSDSAEVESLMRPLARNLVDEGIDAGRIEAIIAEAVRAHREP